MDANEEDALNEEEAFVEIDNGEIVGGRVVEDLDDDDDDAFVDADDDDDEDGVGNLEGPERSESRLTEDMQPSSQFASAASGMMDCVPEADEAVRVFRSHTDAVLALAWRPGSLDHFVSGGCDDVACLWHVPEEGAAPICLTGHSDSVACVAFDPMGATLATGGMDGVIRLWNGSTGALEATLDGPSEAIEWLQWHPKGTVLLAGSEDMLLWMFNAPQRQCMQVFSGHSAPVTAGGFTPDGKIIVSAGGPGDSSIRIWNPRTAEAEHTVAAGYEHHDEQGIACLAVAPDGSMLATGGVDSAVVVCNITTGKAVTKLQGVHDASIEGVAFVEDLPLLVSASLDGRLVVWDYASSTPRGVCQHPAGISALCVPSSSLLFATGCTNGMICVVDVRAAAIQLQFAGHYSEDKQCAVQCLAWSSDNRQLLSGGDDATIRLYGI